MFWARTEFVYVLCVGLKKGDFYPTPTQSKLLFHKALLKISETCAESRPTLRSDTLYFQRILILY